jgi:hypothetical protein
MAEWGRKESAKAWPSRSRAWAWGAVFLTGVFSVEAIWVDEATRWTEAEQLYLVDSLKSGTRGALPKMRTRYTLLEGVDGKGKSRLVLGDEIERIANVDGKPAHRLTATKIKDGVVRLEWTEALYNKHALHELLGGSSSRIRRCGTSRSVRFCGRWGSSCCCCWLRFRGTGRGGCCTSMAVVSEGRGW